jgi:predicted transcriptional regulator
MQYDFIIHENKIENIVHTDTDNFKEIFTNIISTMLVTVFPDMIHYRQFTGTFFDVEKFISTQHHQRIFIVPSGKKNEWILFSRFIFTGTERRNRKDVMAEMREILASSHIPPTAIGYGFRSGLRAENFYLSHWQNMTQLEKIDVLKNRVETGFIKLTPKGQKYIGEKIGKIAWKELSTWDRVGVVTKNIKDQRAKREIRDLSQR